MLVKVAPMGEKVVEVSLEDNTTIGDAIRMSGVLVNGRTIMLNNQPVDESTVIPNCNDNVISLANKMKGGR